MVTPSVDCSYHHHCFCLLSFVILDLRLCLLLVLILNLDLVPPVDGLSLQLIRVLRRSWRSQHFIFEGEDLLPALYVEYDLGSGVDAGAGSVQEGSTQNDRGPLITPCIHYHKVCGHVRASHSHTNIFQGSHGVAE